METTFMNDGEPRENDAGDGPLTTAGVWTLETEPPSGLFEARLEMEAAYKAFRKRASALNLSTLAGKLLNYQQAQYRAETTRVKAEFEGTKEGGV